MTTDRMTSESGTTCRAAIVATAAVSQTRAASTGFEAAVDYILDDCFFAIGQVVATRKTLEYDAVLWWRDHYRAKFLRAMAAFGNRWVADRERVTGAALLFGERAVGYAGESPTIDKAAFQRAAADVERFCQLHSKRRARSAGDPVTDRPLIAGYWCTL
jgi:hypothetical protein